MKISVRDLAHCAACPQGVQWYINNNLMEMDWSRVISAHDWCEHLRWLIQRIDAGWKNRVVINGDSFINEYDEQGRRTMCSDSSYCFHRNNYVAENTIYCDLGFGNAQLIREAKERTDIFEVPSNTIKVIIFDDRGRVIERDIKGFGVRRWEYFDDDRLKTMRGEQGQVFHFAYTDHGTLLETTYDGNGRRRSNMPQEDLCVSEGYIKYIDDRGVVQEVILK